MIISAKLMEIGVLSLVGTLFYLTKIGCQKCAYQSRHVLETVEMTALFEKETECIKKITKPTLSSLKCQNYVNAKFALYFDYILSTYHI